MINHNPNQKYKKEIDEEYKNIKQKVLGKYENLPYHLYIKRRAFYWASSIATISDLIELEQIIKDRLDLPLAVNTAGQQPQQNELEDKPAL